MRNLQQWRFLLFGASTTGKSRYFSCMKAATINELKSELNNIPVGQLVELCTRLARFKKENKELLQHGCFNILNIRLLIKCFK